MKIALAQLNYRIGDFEQNTSIMYDAITEARANGADLIIFSELAVCGYPPDDLLDYDWFVEKCEQSLEMVAECCQGIAAVAGGVLRNRDTGRGLFNVACFMQNGRIQNVVKKTLLPTYDVFTESRYFEPSDTVEVIEFMGYKLGIAICEDIWDLYNDFKYEKSPVQALKEAGAQLLIHPSASPFHVGKIGQRDKVFAGNAQRFGLPIIYVNQVGAHADLIFDGDSQVINSRGETVKQLPLFAEAIEYVTLGNADFLSLPVHFEEPDEPAIIREALIYGIRDYFKKMGFKKAILGASGGIDSAVVQCLASAALGPENVTAFLMPSEFSSESSVSDARKLCENLGNKYQILPINEVYEAGSKTLKNLFGDIPFGIAEENMQARIRGLLLMTYSNKFGDILLNTSNKSELSVGYSTLYGDMCGSLCPIGDVYKSKVYALARFINRHSEVIPANIITKSPSAELRPGQKDSDSLPDYSVLDEILSFYIDERKGRDEIITDGYDPATVDKILKLVNKSEYKRYQAPPILRVSGKAFGRGRIMPLVAWYD